MSRGKRTKNSILSAGPLGVSIRLNFGTAEVEAAATASAESKIIDDLNDSNMCELG